jgi:hypothetical protein
MILHSTEELVVPTLKKWDILKFHNNETKSRMNIEIANKKLIHKFNYAIDEMMLNAIVSYENLNSFVIFGKDKVNAFNLYNELFKDNYILYGIKTIELNKQDVIKMLYQFIFPRMIIKSKNDLIEYIGTKYPYIAGFNNNNSELMNISTLILCKRSINDSYPSKDISKPEYCIYIPKNGEEKNICATVIFSQTTIDFIKLQNFDYFLTKENEKSKKMFLKYKNWLYNNVPLEKQCSFMLFSSIVLYLIGNREINDLDLYIDYVDPEIAEKVKQFDEDEMYKYISCKQTDIVAKGSGLYHPDLEIKFKDEFRVALAKESERLTGMKSYSSCSPKAVQSLSENAFSTDLYDCTYEALAKSAIMAWDKSIMHKINQKYHYLVRGGGKGFVSISARLNNEGTKLFIFCNFSKVYKQADAINH